MKNRLRRQEKEVVRNKYGDNTIFLAFRNVASEMCMKTSFQLAPEELFLWCMMELDDMKESQREYAKRVDALVSDLTNDLRDLAQENVSDTDIAKVANEVACALIVCLATQVGTTYNKFVASIMLQIPDEESEQLQSAFMANIWRGVSEEAFTAYIHDYMRNSYYLSDEIMEMLKSQKPIEESPSTEIQQSSLKIAKEKLTSVIVILNAMYKAGWFTRLDGGKLTNRDKTLNEILQYAFNYEGIANISQLLNAAKNRNYKDINDYLNELKGAVSS